MLLHAVRGLIGGVGIMVIAPMQVHYLYAATATSEPATTNAYKSLNSRYHKLELQMRHMAKEMKQMQQAQLQLKKQLAATTPVKTVQTNLAKYQKRSHRRMRRLIRRMDRESERVEALEAKNVHLLIAGDVNTQFLNRGGSDSTFYADASPLIQVRVDKHLFANVALDFYTQNGIAGGSAADLSAANINYELNNYMTLGGGLITSPIGGIVGNYNTAPWNRWLVDGSLQDYLLPPNELGVWTRGGVPAPDSLGYFTYFLFVSNGPSLISTANNYSSLNYGNWFPAAQNGKALGGRISYLPVPSLEIGYSFEVAQPSPSGSYGITSSNIQAVDMNYYYLNQKIDGLFRFRAGWTWDQIGQSNFNSPHVPLLGNISNGGQIEFAYQPTMCGIKYLKNIMGVLRYDRIDGPAGPAFPASGSEQRWSVGLDYWLHSNAVLKFEYQFDNLSNRQPGNNALLLQFAVGI